MKKRFIIPLVLLMVFSLGITAYAFEPRAALANPSLTFDGETAVCSVTCIGNKSTDKIEATLTLYRGNTYVDSWSESGLSRVHVQGECEVDSGVQYRLVLTWYLNDVKQTTITKTGTCP